MAVTEREYLELMVKNVEKSNDETKAYLKETIDEIKNVQSKNCDRLNDLEKSDAAEKARNGFVMSIITFLGMIIAGIIQAFRS